MDGNETLNQPPSSAGPARNSGKRSAGQPGVIRTLQTVISVGLLVATLLTFWTPANLVSSNLMERMFASFESGAPVAEVLPTATPSARPRIGIVAGHWGNDSGSVCVDGLTEESVNLKIAELVRKHLTDSGYDVDVLQEFDSRLTSYQAQALVSIHNDSCDYINDQATGFKVAAAVSNLYPEKSTRLTACLTQRYQAATGLPFHYNTVTLDMTDYHAFREINNNTIAAIIETGFLNLDRDILVNQTDKVARGVVDGILCYLRNEDIPDFSPAPTLAP
jgi:N-acetylmuramoyl-L-alanine amidase